MSGSPQRPDAFTFFELLVVIAIIAILVGMLFTVVNMARNAGKGAQTKAIMHMANAGISITAMQGIIISPTPHPLANTAVKGAISLQRSLFLRGPGTTAQYSLGVPVDQTGEALVVKDTATVDTSALPRLMLPTDVYCGLTAPSATDSPMFFGLDRQHMTILGSGLGLVAYRRLPPILSWDDQDGNGILDNPPYVGTPGTGVAYPDATYLSAEPGDLTDNTAFEIANKRAFDYFLGSEVEGELAQAGGLKTGDSTMSLLSNFRVRASNRYSGITSSTWTPAAFHAVSILQDTDTNWKAYTLRGTALYDAWGHEILLFKAANGSFSFESAGADGLFCWSPGSDGIYQTGASDSVPSGDDLDATTDNIITGQK